MATLSAINSEPADPPKTERAVGLSVHRERLSPDWPS
jgi:hypothetical protein